MSNFGKSSRILAIAFLGLMFSACILTKVNGAIFFQDDFESGNFNNWTTQGTPVIVTNPVANGSRATQFTLTAPTSIQMSFQQTNTLTFECYFRMDTVPSTYDANAFVLINNTQGTVAAIVFYHGTQGIGWGFQYFADGNQLGTTIQSNIQTNTWYKINLALTISASNGTYQFWINNILTYSKTNINNENNGQGYKLTLGNFPTVYPPFQGNIWIDSVTLSNTIDAIPEASSLLGLLSLMVVTSLIIAAYKKRVSAKVDQSSICS